MIIALLALLLVYVAGVYGIAHVTGETSKYARMTSGSDDFFLALVTLWSLIAATVLIFGFVIR